MRATLVVGQIHAFVRQNCEVQQPGYEPVLSQPDHQREGDESGGVLMNIFIEQMQRSYDCDMNGERTLLRLDDM